ncbi:MAG TPA: nucleotidyltransferase family protein [Thermohalobaculum sp.]|nr:nucleotidyltransferase family protein [Thermohalobaculum sp.]
MGAAEHGGIAGWPAPLRLLVALLGDAAPPRVALDREQWHDFARLVIERHRVAPPVLAALEKLDMAVPAEVLDRIRAEARANALAALAQKAETSRLVARLAALGCRPMLLKGWPLAEEIAGSAAARHSKDLDLYIRLDELDACYRVLAGLGYAPVSEHRGRLPLIGDPALASECNDLALVRPDGAQVEVHWRSHHFRGWLDLREICGEGRAWAIDGTGLSVRVPSVTGNLLYLALHGQQHAWLRLKWLHDIALILRQLDDAALRAALEAAAPAAVERPLVGAVHLAHRVFGARLPAAWPAPDRVTRRMLARFVRGIAIEAAPPGSPRARFDFYWGGFVMAQGVAQRLGVLRYAFWRGPRLFLASLRSGARPARLSPDGGDA